MSNSISCLSGNSRGLVLAPLLAVILNVNLVLLIVSALILTKTSDADLLRCATVIEKVSERAARKQEREAEYFNSIKLKDQEKAEAQRIAGEWSSRKWNYLSDAEMVLGVRHLVEESPHLTLHQKIIAIKAIQEFESFNGNILLDAKEYPKYHEVQYENGGRPVIDLAKLGHLSDRVLLHELVHYLDDVKGLYRIHALKPSEVLLAKKVLSGWPIHKGSPFEVQMDSNCLLALRYRIERSRLSKAQKLMTIASLVQSAGGEGVKTVVIDDLAQHRATYDAQTKRLRLSIKDLGTPEFAESIRHLRAWSKTDEFEKEYFRTRGKSSEPGWAEFIERRAISKDGSAKQYKDFPFTERLRRYANRPEYRKIVGLMLSGGRVESLGPKDRRLLNEILEALESLGDIQIGHHIEPLVPTPIKSSSTERAKARKDKENVNKVSLEWSFETASETWKTEEQKTWLGEIKALYNLPLLLNKRKWKRDLHLARILGPTRLESPQAVMANIFNLRIGESRDWSADLLGRSAAYNWDLAEYLNYLDPQPQIVQMLFNSDSLGLAAYRLQIHQWLRGGGISEDRAKAIERVLMSLGILKCPDFYSKKSLSTDEMDSLFLNSSLLAGAFDTRVGSVLKNQDLTKYLSQLNRAKDFGFLYKLNRLGIEVTQPLWSSFHAAVCSSAIGPETRKLKDQAENLPQWKERMLEALGRQFKNRAELLEYSETKLIPFLRTYLLPTEAGELERRVRKTIEK